MLQKLTDLRKNINGYLKSFLKNDDGNGLTGKGRLIIFLLAFSSVYSESLIIFFTLLYHGVRDVRFSSSEMDTPKEQYMLVERQKMTKAENFWLFQTLKVNSYTI